MSKDPPVVSLSPDYHIAVGQITVNAAMMDQLIDNAISLVLKMPPERGKTITGLILSTKRKILLLHDLIIPMIKNDSLRTEFLDVFCKLTSAQANRSKIVHAKWMFMASNQEIHIEVPESDDMVAVVEPMPLKRLQGYGTEIGRAHKALEDFFLKVELRPEETGPHVWPPRAELRPARQRGKKKKKNS